MSRQRLRTWSPWSTTDAARALAIAAAGHVVWAVSWWMATQERAFERQMPAMNVAAVGFVIVAYAEVSWLLRSHRRIVDRRRRLLADDAFGAARTAADGLPGPDGVVAGPGLGLYHTRGCRFAVGRAWPTMAAAVAAAEGRQPCGVCRP